MIICLDLRYKTESGASSYIKNLVPALLNIKSDSQYIFVKYPSQKFDFENKACKIISSPDISDIAQLVWDMLVLPKKLAAMKVDIYHPLKNPGSPRGSFKKVFTVHSINVSYKGIFPTSFKKHLYHSVYTNYFTKKCDRIIAVSIFLKDFAVEALNIDANKVDTIYHGIDPKFQKIAQGQVSKIIKKYNLPTDYILSVGNITPVKNHLTTAKAFALIADKVKENYVIVGSRKDKYFQDVYEFTTKSQLTERILFPGFINPNDLPALMNGAKLLLFPSLTEGCPVTMLESFACGLPVIASKRGGLWDLGKECAEFVEDPMDYSGFAKKIEYHLTSDKKRNLLSRKSTTESQKYSWEQTAQAHLNTYRQCYHNLSKHNK